MLLVYLPKMVENRPGQIRIPPGNPEIVPTMYTKPMCALNPVFFCLYICSRVHRVISRHFSKGAGYALIDFIAENLPKHFPLVPPVLVGGSRGFWSPVLSQVFTHSRGDWVPAVPGASLAPS